MTVSIATPIRRDQNGDTSLSYIVSLSLYTVIALVLELLVVTEEAGSG